jgi:hypothetical protein
VLELKDDISPSVTHNKVLCLLAEAVTSCQRTYYYLTQDPPPWIPADAQHTTTGASEKAELHMIRAVNTGIINVS